MNIQSDFVEICWTKSTEEVDYYQIRYKSTGGSEKWKFAETDSDNNHIVVTGLMADTRYTFQVRGVFNDQEGCYGPANDALKTAESLATFLLNYSIKVSSGNPPKYQLPSQEQITSRNPIAKTRKLILGKMKCCLYATTCILFLIYTNQLKHELLFVLRKSKARV